MTIQDELTLELASDDDLPAVVTLINRSYRGETAREGWAHEADYIDGERITLDALRADLAAKPDAKILLRRDTLDGSIIGCLWLEPKDAETWYIGLLTVRPDQQARRLGRRLLASSENRVRHAGGRRMRLTVVSLRESLICWYVRRGYHLTGELRPFPVVDPPRLDLKLAVLEKKLPLA